MREAELEWHGVEGLPGYLRRVLGARCRDENELDDVVQETCVRAARYRGSLSAEARLKPWAARIALNVLRSQARRGQDARVRALEHDEEDLLACPGSLGPEVLVFRAGPWSVDYEEALVHLRLALGRLRSPDRRLLAVYYGGDESCRRAARACRLTPDVAKVRLFRARQRLQRLMRQSISRSGAAWTGPAESAAGTRARRSGGAAG